MRNGFQRDQLSLVVLFAFDHQPMEFLEVLAFPDGFWVSSRISCSYSIREYKPCEVTDRKIWFVLLTKFLKQLFSFPSRSYSVPTFNAGDYKCVSCMFCYGMFSCRSFCEPFLYVQKVLAQSE